MSRVRARRLQLRAGEGLSTAEQDSLNYFALGVFSSVEERRRAWHYAREYLIDRSGPHGRPAAFWQYEPGIPAALRERDTSSVETFQAQRAARTAWLRDHAR